MPDARKKLNRVKRFLSKPRGKDAICTIAGFTIGIIASIILGLTTLDNVHTLVKVCLGLGTTALTTWLGWVSDKLKAISTRVPDKKDVESFHADFMAELSTENALLRLERLSKPAHSVVSGYANTKACHVIEHGEQVFIDEYLDMLERSLVLADKRIFATSLLLPETWLGDDSYKGYLRDQKRKIEASGIQIKRVFISPRKDFESNDDALGELRQLHKDAKIALGFCDKDILLNKFGRGFYKDFVMFVATEGSWVIDGGKLGMKQKSRDRSPISVVVHHRPESVNNRFRSLEHRITQHVRITDWLVQPEWLKIE